MQYHASSAAAAPPTAVRANAAYVVGILNLAYSLYHGPEWYTTIPTTLYAQMLLMPWAVSNVAYMMGQSGIPQYLMWGYLT